MEVNLVNLLDVVTGSGAVSALEIIRLDGNEKPVIFFTPEAKEILRHYADYHDLRGYIPCNGDDCDMCKIGNKADQVFLVPVYAPLEKVVGVLPVSAAQSPHSLLPKIQPILASPKPMVTLISRAGSVYTVKASPIPDNLDSGEALIQAFRASLEAGEINLESVYEKRSNAALAMIPEVRDFLLLKGIVPKDTGSVISTATESAEC